MYQAQRAQDHGNKDQALVFYHTVLAEDPSCTQATENVMVLMQASQSVLQEALDTAAKLVAEQAAAEQAAAEQAAEQAAAEQAAAEQAAAEQAAAEQAAAEQAAEQAAAEQAAAEQAAAEQAAAEQAAAEQAAAQQAAAQQAAAQQAAAQQAAAQQAAAQQAAADLQQMLGGITAGMQRIVIKDARFAADGTLVCRSTYNAHHRGIGWDDNDNYTSESSGIRYNLFQPLPHEERFRCWRCNGFGHMRAACPLA